MPPPPFFSPLDPRRHAIRQAKRLLLLEEDEMREGAGDRPPRLTDADLAPSSTHPHPSRMSRSRDRILANLDDMYREAFERAKASGDQSQMGALDFAYRREQLYFEILLDVRDAMEKR